MIYWFIGQPGSGKTTLARLLKRDFQLKGFFPILHIDGDDLRIIFGNNYNKENFTKSYRIEQLEILQRFVAYIADQGVTVVVSTVSPYREIRDKFKNSRTDVKEIYVSSCEIRGREHLHSKEFEPPTENFINICTSLELPETSIKRLWDLI